MADKINYTHGDSGSKPPDGNDFDKDERPQASYFDWYISTLVTKHNSVIDELDTIDSDNDGIVDEADTANLYKDNDIDNDADGIVNEADYANDADASTYKGNDIDTNGDGKVDASVEADNTQTVKETNLDTNYHAVDDSGTVKAGDAGILFQTELKDGESLNLYQVTFTAPDGSPAPSGLYLVFITLDGSGGSTLQSNMISGDGTTLHVDKTGTPFFSYTNTSGSVQQVGYAVDNGQYNSGAGQDVDMYTSTNMRVE